MRKERKIVGRVAGTEVSYSEMRREEARLTIDGVEVARGQRVLFNMRPKNNGWRPVYPRWNDWLFAAQLLAFCAAMGAYLFSTWSNVLLADAVMFWFGWWRAAKQRDHLEAWLAEVHTREDDGPNVYTARPGKWEDPL